MNKLISFVLLSCIALFTLSCGDDDTASGEFNDANGNVQPKLIESIAVTSAQDPLENTTVMFTYTSDGQLSTISDGSETGIFVYDNSDNLTNISGSGDNLNIEELYESPYDAFETGDVIAYDGDGNPITIEFYEEEYDFNTDTYVTKVYTADISYDDEHNPYFFTLEAGGLIEVMDDVELNFSMNPQLPEIVQARMLFPVNNPSQIIYKNEEGAIIYTINANYVYDDENYPTSATVTSIEAEDSGLSTYTAVFTYVED
ncbi:hypothetical protein [Winogradskyella sp.]|uniref:hypothetical protein n=1 Tax=Winogradskyella sp. TaxID=1883156 RepID=UPI00262292F9|nr:hypothetical protein [Winogradskyella sp.]